MSPLTQLFYEISYEPLRLRPADRADEVIEYAKCPLLAQSGYTDGSSNYLCGLSYVPSRDAQILMPPLWITRAIHITSLSFACCFIGTAFRLIGLIQAERSMIGDAKTHEWNLLKEQFAKLARAGAVRADDAEVLLDVEFQRRLAEVIEQVLKRRRGFIHHFR